jgi:DNA-damage-inducible protein D
MLKLFDYLESILEEHGSRQWYYDSRLIYSRNEIMEMLEVDNEKEINSALKRAVSVCESLQIPIRSHFKEIYCFDGKSLLRDWRLSPFACYLIIINCNPGNKNVAKAQIYFAMNQSIYK